MRQSVEIYLASERAIIMSEQAENGAIMKVESFLLQIKTERASEQSEQASENTFRCKITALWPPFLVHPDMWCTLIQIKGEIAYHSQQSQQSQPFTPFSEESTRMRQIHS